MCMLFNNYFINYKIIVLQGLIRGPCYTYVEKMERERELDRGREKERRGKERERGRERE